LRCDEVAAPAPKPGEVVLRVGACGVCGSDIPRVFTKGTYHFPTIPGHEMSGTVVTLGAGADPALLGKAATVFPLVPCRRCAACEIGAYAQCADYNYLGSRCDGGFAEYVAVPVWNLVMVPDGVTLQEAAMVEPAAVAAHALRRAGIDLGDAVLILGAGPIGLMLALWARAWGAGKVLLTDIDEQKLEFAKTLGFSDVFNSKTGALKDWVANVTGRGADLVVEASGSSVAFEQAMGAARTFGKVVLLGNPAGAMTLSQDAYWAVLRKELTVTGSWNSSYSNTPRNEWKLVLDSVASGKLDLKPLITHRVGLAGLWDALVMLRDRSAFANKVMYVNGSTE
jgi:L-iditol 2-dehydrogenase